MQAQIVQDPMGKREEEGRGGVYLGLANRFFVGEGIIVAVDEAEDAEEEEESSSCARSGDGVLLSNWSSSSSS